MWDYSTRTEDTYVTWVKNFILFHDKRHPKDMGAPEIAAFITPSGSRTECRRLVPKPLH